MKKARTWASILLAALLLTVMVAPAAMAAGSVYTGKSGDNYDIVEKLLLENADTIVPTVTYTLTLDDTIRTAAGAATVNANSYTGKPTITQDKVIFNASSTVKGNGSNYGRYVEGSFSIDFSTVTFFEPGIYRYNLTKTVTTEEEVGQDKAITNTRSSDYVLLYVAGNEGLTDGAATLKDVVYVMEDKDEEYVNGSKIGKTHLDRYTSSSNNLIISKVVKGTMGSKSEYFQFNITLSGGVAGSTYIVEGTYDASTVVNTHNDQAYNNRTLLSENSRENTSGATEYYITLAVVSTQDGSKC